jgi:hypothetical protein
MLYELIFEVSMFKKFFLLSTLSLLFFSCDPGVTCPSGEVYQEELNECVTNTCINVNCGQGAACVVTTKGPKCSCSSPLEKMDASGNCHYDESSEITCSGTDRGTPVVNSGQVSCSCKSGYKQLASGVYSCVPTSFLSYCPSGTCANGTIIPYFENKPTNGVNFFIASEGYQASDLTYNGKFSLDAIKFIGLLMNREPYKKFAKYINFYIVYAASVDKGVDLNCTSDTINSVFNGCLDNPGVSTVMRIRDIDKLNTYLRRSGKTPHLKIIIFNEDRYYAGTAFSNHKIAMFPRKGGPNSSDTTNGLTLYHEVGHAFGQLGDEYGRAGASVSYPIPAHFSQVNLSTTNNLSIIKWKHLIPHYTNLGAIEGGFYSDTGVWRAQQKCVMRSFYETTELCPVCKEGIVRQIYSILGKTYNLNDFLNAYPPSSTRTESTELQALTPQERLNLKELNLMLNNSQDVFTQEEVEMMQIR